MLTYCLKCKKDTKNVNSRVLKNKNGRRMSSSRCAVCGNKKSRFIKEQEATGLLSSLGLKTPLKKFRYLVTFCFNLDLI